MPDDIVTDNEFFSDWTRVTSRAQLELRWVRLVARLEANLQRGQEWSDEEHATLHDALLCWDYLGGQEALTWDDDKWRKFKGKWEAWCAEVERKLAAGGVLTLEEERYRAYAKGVWWACGYLDGSQMDAEGVKKFKVEWGNYAEAERRRESSGQVRTLRGEAYDNWGCGVWRAESERDKARLSQAAARVVDATRARLKPWPDTLANEDYDFGVWVDAIAKSDDEEEQRARLMAGVLYEYARESEKLRGLLTLLNPGAGKDEDDMNRPESFDGLDEGIAEKALGNWFPVLLELADDLAANVPFPKVDSKRLDSALFIRGTDKDGKPYRLSRLKCEFGRTLWHVPPVALAYEGERSIAAGLETMVDWSRGRTVEKLLGAPEPRKPRKRTFHSDQNQKDCEEVLLVRVNWGFTNKQLGEALADLARRYRPVEEFEEPDQKAGSGTGREIEWTQHLSALAALRLGHMLPFKAAEAEFQKVKSKLGSSGAPQERRKFEAKREQASQSFSACFPFGERPKHYLPWSSRTEAESKWDGI